MIRKNWNIIFFFNTINYRHQINVNNKLKVPLENNVEEDEFIDLSLNPNDNVKKEKLKDDHLMSDENNKIGSV